MKVLGIFLIIGGVILGLFVGGYLCFFKGIVDILEQLKGDFDVVTIAWGIVKIYFAGVLGGLSALPFVILGYAIVD